MDKNPIYVFTEESIGYLNTGWNIFMIFLSCFGIIINLFFGITYLRRIIQIKKGTSQNKVIVSLIEKILCLISIVESFISIGWLINSIFMYSYSQQNDKNQYKSEHEIQCKILGSFEIFFYLFDWMILSFSLYQIKQMVMNPLHLLKSDLLLAKNIMIFAGISLLFVIFCTIFDMAGTSPLLTCFISIAEVNKESSIIIKNIIFWIFFTSPIIFFGLGFYQIYVMTKSNNFKGDERQKKFFMKYFAYILIYIIMAFLLITLYLINYIYNKEPGVIMKLYIQIVTILSCSTPLFVGIFRLIKTNLIRKCGNNENTLNQNLLENNNQKIKDFNEFENDLLKKTIIKYYIAISYVLGKAKYYNEEEETSEGTNIENKNELQNINDKNENENGKELINKENNENENINENNIVKESNNTTQEKEKKDIMDENINNKEKEEDKTKDTIQDIDNKNENIDINININDEEGSAKLDNLNNDSNSQENTKMNDSQNKLTESVLDIAPLTQEDEYLSKENITYNFTKIDILKDLDLSINEDLVVLTQPNIDITITEYNTQLFKKLRQLDDISEDYIIKLIQPKRSKVNLMQTYKKNDLFYINSTNKEYLIKEISLEELNFYRNIIINIYRYLKKNKNSLILRIRGLYDVLFDDSPKNKKKYIALMDNIYESLDIEIPNNSIIDNKIEKIEKINKIKGIKIHKLKEGQFNKSLCLFVNDSSNNVHEYSVDLGNIKQNEIYKIYLDKKDYNNIQNIIRKDNKFLKKIGVLNYCFLVVEIPLNEKYIETIFNENNNNNKNIEHLKNYFFKSKKDNNILYSISIVDYYKDPIKKYNI